MEQKCVCVCVSVFFGVSLSPSHPRTSSGVAARPELVVAHIQHIVEEQQALAK